MNIKKVIIGCACGAFLFIDSFGMRFGNTGGNDGYNNRPGGYKHVSLSANSSFAGFNHHVNNGTSGYQPPISNFSENSSLSDFCILPAQEITGTEFQNCSYKPTQQIQSTESQESTPTDSSLGVVTFSLQKKNKFHFPLFSELNSKTFPVEEARKQED